jgi:cystathionine beta-lyase
VITLADNSWATPLYQNPIALGIDLVVHSGTKYIAGHSDLLLGLVAGPTELMARVRETARLLGGVLSPDDAYLAIRGIRTLPLRMARHHASALRIARWLEKRPEVREVLHPGLESFPGHELARSQMTGYSGLFSFRLQRRDGAARHRFVDSLLSLFYLGYSWGGYESLIVPRMDQDDTYRVSIGLEAPDDLMTALNDALVAWSHD